MAKLVCNGCGRVYTEKEDIELAKKIEEDWKAICKSDGVEAKGIAACPNMTCKGELVLEDGGKD